MPKHPSQSFTLHAGHGPRRRKLDGDDLLVAAGKKRHPDLARLEAEWEQAEHGSDDAIVLPTISTSAAPLVNIEVDENDRGPAIQLGLFV